MIKKNVHIELSKYKLEELEEQATKLADHYLIKERWPSHQSVFKAVTSLLDIAYPPDILRMVSGFTAGVGFTGELCGALAGAIAVLGFIYGSHDPIDKEKYKLFQEHIVAENIPPSEKAKQLVDNFENDVIYNRMILEFEDNFGRVRCKEIISPYKDDPVSRKRFGRCRRVVRQTAGLTLKLIWGIEKNGELPVMGKNIYSDLY